MTAREVNRLFLGVLRAGVPALAIACGDASSPEIAGEAGDYETFVCDGSVADFEVPAEVVREMPGEGRIDDCRDWCLPQEARDEGHRSSNVISCRFTGNFHGAPIARCTFHLKYSCVSGRFTGGLRAEPVRRGSVVARELARLAQCEAGSVPAFERLARELAAHGAPKRLQIRAIRAAGDERRHARAMTRLTREAGGDVPAIRMGALEVRSLVDVALENAREGCVNETYAAGVTLASGRGAATARFRRVFSAIAQDELRHAALAHDVDAWFGALATRHERRRVAVERRAAGEELRASARVPVEAVLTRVLGIPAPATAGKLAAAVVAMASRA